MKKEIIDWVDTNDIKVLVPYEYDKEEIEVPVDRCSKYIKFFTSVNYMKFLSQLY